MLDCLLEETNMEEKKEVNTGPLGNDTAKEKKAKEKLEENVLSSKANRAPSNPDQDDSSLNNNVSNVAEENLSHSCSPKAEKSNEVATVKNTSVVKDDTTTDESRLTSNLLDEENETCSTCLREPSVAEKQEAGEHSEQKLSAPAGNDERNTPSPVASEDSTNGSNTSKRKQDKNVSNSAVGVTDVQLHFAEPLNKRRRNGKNDGQSEDKGDHYCWVCHRDGTIIACATCPRVYHLRCVQLEGVPSEEWVCPECITILSAENVETRSRAMRQLSVDQLSNLLKFALERMMAYPGTEPFAKPVDLVEFPRYQEFVAHPMDLSQLERNIKRHMYGSTEAFIADTKWILHDCIIFNTHHTKLSSTAKGILKVCKQEMSEIEICPDCYLNAHARNESWFIEVCRKPHVLLWAKLKGFPFWPAKVMRTSRENMVDVRFFGAHDRAWVPLRDCYLYSRLIPAAARNKKKHNLDACVNEVELHIRRLRECYGRFEYAPFRSPFEPSREAEHLSMFLPSYEEEYGPRLIPGRPSVRRSKRSSGRPPSASQQEGDTDSSANAQEDGVESESSVSTPPPQESRPLRVYGRVRQASDSPSSPPTITIKQEPEEVQKTSALLSDWLRFEQVAAQITLSMSIGSDTEAEESEHPQVNVLKFESTEGQESRGDKPHDQKESDSRSTAKKDILKNPIKNETVETENLEEEQELPSDKTDNEKVDCGAGKGTDIVEETVVEDSSAPLVPETVAKDLEESEDSEKNIKRCIQDEDRKDTGESEMSDIPSKKADGCKEIKETGKSGTVVSVGGENEGNEKLVPDSDMESVNITENDDTSSLSSSSDEVDSEVWEQISATEDKGGGEQMDVEAEGNCEEKMENRSDTVNEKSEDATSVRKRPAEEMESKESGDEKAVGPSSKLRKLSMEGREVGKRSLETRVPGRRRSEGDAIAQGSKAGIKGGLLPDLIRRLHGSQPRVYLSKMRMPGFHRTYNMCSSLLLGNKKRKVRAEKEKEKSHSPSSRIMSGSGSSNREELVSEEKSTETKSPKKKDNSAESTVIPSSVPTTTDDDDDDVGKSKSTGMGETEDKCEGGGSDEKNGEPMEHSGKEEAETPTENENKPEPEITGTKESEVSEETVIGGVEEKSDEEASKLNTMSGEKEIEKSKEDETEEEPEDVRMESSERLKGAEDSNSAQVAETGLEIEPPANSEGKNDAKTVQENKKNRTRTAKVADKLESLSKSSKISPDGQNSNAITTKDPSEAEALTNSKGEKESDILLTQIKQEPEDIEEANEEDVASENETEAVPTRSKEPGSEQTSDAPGDTVNPSFLYPSVTITVENDKQIEVNSSTPAKDCTINIEQVKASVGLPQAISLSVISSDTEAGEEYKDGELATDGGSASDASKTQTSSAQSPTVPTIVTTSTGYSVTAQNGLEISTQPAEPPPAPEPAPPRSRARKSFPNRPHPQVKITHSFTNGLVRGGSGSIVAARQLSNSSMQQSSTEEQLPNGEGPMVFIPPSPGRPAALLVNGERPPLPALVAGSAMLPRLAPRMQLAAAATAEPLDLAGPGPMPFVHVQPPTPSPITAKYPNAIPADAGPATFDLSRHSQKLASYMQQALEDILHDVAAAGGMEATVKMLQLELEKLQWKHQQELAEIKHNTHMLMRELKASVAKEKQQLVDDTLRQCEAEKQRAVEATKKKQWCTNCGKEALFYCCWNTSYCDYPCQQRHWPQHMASCGQAESMKAREAAENGHPQSTASLVHHAPGKNCQPPSQPWPDPVPNSNPWSSPPFGGVGGGGKSTEDRRSSSRSPSPAGEGADPNASSNGSEGLPHGGSGHIRRRRCGSCAGCMRAHCGRCHPCRNTRTHQVCQERRCSNLQPMESVTVPRARNQKLLALPAQLGLAGKGSGSLTSPVALPGPQLQPQPQQQRRRAPGAPFSLLPMPRPGSMQGPLLSSCATYLGVAPRAVLASQPPQPPQHQSQPQRLQVLGSRFPLPPLPRQAPPPVPFALRPAHYYI